MTRNPFARRGLLLALLLSSAALAARAQNVGVGTLTPGEKLDVVGGNLRLSTAGSRLIFPDGTFQTTAAASGSFIQNQTAAAQTGGFNLSGTGVLGGSLRAASVRIDNLTTAGFVLSDASGNLSSTSTTGNSFVNNTPTAQTGANFNVGGAGTVGGLLTANGGATVVGATNVNTSGAAATNIGTGTTAGAVTIGRSGGTVTIPRLTTAGLVTTDASGNLSSATAASLDPTTASNGLTKVGNDFRLGGTLAAATTIAQGSNAFSLTGTGNVGIGTPAPTQKLDVRGNLRLGEDGGAVTGTGNVVEFIGPGINTDPIGLYRINTASDASELRVVVGDNLDVNDKFSVGRTTTSTEGTLATGTFTPVFTVRADGKVGLGTASPAYALHLGDATTGGSAHALLQGVFGNASYLRHSRLMFNDVNFGIGAGNMSNTAADADLYFYAFDGPDRDIRFMHTANALTDPSGAGWTTDLIIKQGGNVGVGTISPFSRFSFGSTTTNANAAAGRLAIYEATTGTNFYGLGLVQNGGGNFGMGLWGGSGSATPYNGSTGTLPNLYLDQATSNVGIGTISPATRLDVNGNLRLAVRLCPVNTAGIYTLVAADVAFSIFKTQIGNAVSTITLPGSIGQVEGQELTIINASDINVTVNGSTDNGGGATLPNANGPGIHAVKYVWATYSGGTGAWFRVQ